MNIYIYIYIYKFTVKYILRYFVYLYIGIYRTNKTNTSKLSTLRFAFLGVFMYVCVMLPWSNFWQFSQDNSYKFIHLSANTDTFFDDRILSMSLFKWSRNSFLILVNSIFLRTYRFQRHSGPPFCGGVTNVLNPNVYPHSLYFFYINYMLSILIFLQSSQISLPYILNIWISIVLVYFSTNNQSYSLPCLIK